MVNADREDVHIKAYYLGELDLEDAILLWRKGIELPQTRAELEEEIREHDCILGGCRCERESIVRIRETLNKSTAAERRIFSARNTVPKLENTQSIPPILEP